MLSTADFRIIGFHHYANTVNFSNSDPDQETVYEDSMKKNLLICSILFSLSFSTPSFANQPINGIAAVVNDSIITQADLDKRIAAIKVQIQKSGAPAPSNGELCQQVLQQMIDRKLQLQKADELGLTATDSDVDKAMQHIAEQNHVSQAALMNMLKTNGINEKDFKSDIHDEILIQEAQGKFVASRISVSPEEVDDFMHDFVQTNNAATEFHLQDILIGLPDSPTTEQIAKAKAHADQIAAALRKGANFQQLAQANSKGEQALEGGDLGWKKLGELPTPFVTSVASMQTGQIAGPIQTPNGFHILKLLAVRNQSGLTGTPAQRKTQAENMIFQRKLQEDLINWISQLRAQAYIKKFPVCPAIPKNETNGIGAN